MNEKPEAWTAIDSFVWPHIAANLIREQHADNERLRDELRQSSIDHTRAEVERLTATAFQAQNAAIDLAQRYKRLKGLLLDIRNDAQTSHWHRDIDAALQEPPR